MTDYADVTDSELEYMLLSNDEEVKEIIFQKYRYLIDVNIKKNARAIAQFKIDEAEIRQEASYGFSDGISTFSENKGASLSTFLNLCIQRRIHKAIDKYSSQKALAIKETLSLDNVIDESDRTLIDTIAHEDKYDPLNDLTSVEKLKDLIKAIKNDLSEKEYQVFILYAIKDKNYQQIAKILGQSPKQIDNTIQRIKIKLRKVLKD